MKNKILKNKFFNLFKTISFEDQKIPHEFGILGPRKSSDFRGFQSLAIRGMAS